MNIFLEQMSRYLGDREAIIVMDCAGWHKSQALVVPKNITIIYLPPYSPELNPVERFWKFIKQNTIKNKVYDTLDDLENELSNFIKALSPNTIALACRINYL